MLYFVNGGGRGDWDVGIKFWFDILLSDGGWRVVGDGVDRI